MLTLDQLRIKTPSVFAQHASSDRTSKYQHISTPEIIGMLTEKGFTVDRAIEAKTRKYGWNGYQKHQVFFDIPGETNSDHKLQLRLINSSNGGSSLQLHIGIYVFVCSNGLVKSNGEQGKLCIIHKGNPAKQFMKSVEYAINRIPYTKRIIQTMTQTVMGKVEQEKFAQYALGLRWKQEDVSFTPQDLLTCHHDLQSDPTVWNIYNRLQEKTIQGFYYQGRRQVRRTRQIKSIDSDLKINQALWKYAEEVCI